MIFCFFWKRWFIVNGRAPLENHDPFTDLKVESMKVRGKHTKPSLVASTVVMNL